MAIAAGSVVAFKLALVGAQSGKGPLFGIAESGAPFTVLWENGQHSTGLLATSIEEILAADAAVVNALVGRVCKITNPTGQNNFGQGVCVACYKRLTDTYALLQNQATGFFIEALIANVAAI